MIKNLWDAAEAVLRGNLMVIKVNLRKEEKSRLNNLTLYLREVEKQEQRNPNLVEKRNYEGQSRNK